ncbi:MAG: hypothetical protein EOM20_15635 [Spartobacteria bacterium]|nr:hypothetical protein [Spartobacteria bacterium]
MSIGMAYLDMVVQILKPHTVVAVGRVATGLLCGRYPSLGFQAFFQFHGN